MHHAKSERSIRPRSRRHIQISLGRRAREHRVDHHKLRAVFARIGNEMPLLDLGLRHIAAPENHAACIRNVAGIVGVPVFAETKRIDGAAEQCVVSKEHEVREAEHVLKAHVSIHAEARVAIADGEADAVGAVLLYVTAPFLGDVLERLVPRQTLPFATAPRRPLNAAHRIFDARVRIDALRKRESFQADAVVLGIGEIARLGANHPAVADNVVEKTSLKAVTAATARKLRFSLNGRIPFLRQPERRREHRPAHRSCPCHGTRRLEKASAGQPGMRAFRFRHFSSSK